VPVPVDPAGPEDYELAPGCVVTFLVIACLIVIVVILLG
jgi:hypothetical protein